MNQFIDAIQGHDKKVKHFTLFSNLRPWAVTSFALM